MKLKEIEFCMKRKCKVCSKYETCDLKFKDKEILTYKPFENLFEILEKKKNDNRTR